MDLENSQIAILHGLSKIIEGKGALPMKITEVPVSQEAAQLQATLNEKMLGTYDQDGSFKVRISND